MFVGVADTPLVVIVGIRVVAILSHRLCLETTTMPTITMPAATTIPTTTMPTTMPIKA